MCRVWKLRTWKSRSRPKTARRILHGVNLEIKDGEIHAIMGPNGSGKSTMAYAIAGTPPTRSRAAKSSWTATTSSRAARRTREGRSVPRHAVPRGGPRRHRVELPAHGAHGDRRQGPGAASWVKMKEAMEQLRVDPAFAERDLNAGFSGGEKKRLEILQMQLLHPKFAVLDETDSGLDIDALRVVSEGVNHVHDQVGCGVMPSPTTRASSTTSSPTTSTSSPVVASSNRVAPSWPRCSSATVTTSTSRRSEETR
ncbi:ATP-binding cassette domain-containing protein [Nanchangia anserum]|nr:ATP-binding cassette domain-containing protein [Nanchangia anserum]